MRENCRTAGGLRGLSRSTCPEIYIAQLSSCRSAMNFRATVSSLLLVTVAAQRGSPFRCRDRDPKCKNWASTGECSANHGFMAESCPAACDYCDNAGLYPTPSGFQLDFVCSDQLAINPGTFKDLREEMPDGCEFRCRDNMTSCAAAAAEGACEKKATAGVARFQCPASCGVCKALELPATPYPKHACAHEEGDDPAHTESCSGWAAAGECVKNFGFMKLSCELSCGLCALDGTKPKAYRDILSPPRKAASGTAASKKKKKKATAAASVSATGEAAPVKAEPEAAPKAAEAAPKAAEAPKENVKVKATPKAKGEPLTRKEGSLPTKKAEEEPKKKKGWMGGLRDAVGGAFGKKKPKDEV